MPHRYVKIINLLTRDHEDKRDMFSRDQWRDKRIMYLDCNGKSWRQNNWRVEGAPILVEEQCIDIMADHDAFYGKYLQG